MTVTRTLCRLPAVLRSAFVLGAFAPAAIAFVAGGCGEEDSTSVPPAAGPAAAAHLPQEPRLRPAASSPTTEALEARLLAADALVTQKLEELEKRAIADAVATLTNAELKNPGMKDPAAPGERKPLQLPFEQAREFGWSEIDLSRLAGFEAKHFPHTSFIETTCVLSDPVPNYNTHMLRSWAKYAIDRKTGRVRQIERSDRHGRVEDEGVFTALVREGRIVLQEEADVAGFFHWGRSIIHSPQAFFGVCGNSVFGAKATKVDGGWTYVTTVDGGRDFAWKISCDADGIVTDVDRNVAKLPAGRTREWMRAYWMEEFKRKEEAKIWWDEEAKQADLAGLVEKADLVGIAGDFTGGSGTQRLYRVFAFRDGGLLFGDRSLGNYYRDFYMASVQFPFTMERRFERDSSDKWIVFLTARMDQAIHRESTRGFSPAYDPAGEHAVLRATDELIAEVKKLVATKKANPERDAAIRKAAEAESAAAADSRTSLLLARFAAKRVTEGGFEPTLLEPDADKTRDGFRQSAFSHLRAAQYYLGQKKLDREALEADPALAPLKDDPRWRQALESAGK
jgi:hypothetical protein